MQSKWLDSYADRRTNGRQINVASEDPSWKPNGLLLYYNKNAEYQKANHLGAIFMKTKEWGKIFFPMGDKKKHWVKVENPTLSFSLISYKCTSKSIGCLKPW